MYSVEIIDTRSNVLYHVEMYIKVRSLCGNYTDMGLSLFRTKRELPADALSENTLRGSENGAL